METLKKYYAFVPAKNGEVTFGLERVADIEDEIRELHVEHYEETEEGYLGTPFNPSYDRYKASEEAGQFILFTVRIGSDLAGYLQYWTFEGMYTNAKQAKEDAFFIRKQFRGKKLATPLLSYAEDALRQLGCSTIGMTSKQPVGGADIGEFLMKRGYSKVAVYYVKKLEKKDVL